VELVVILFVPKLLNLFISSIIVALMPKRYSWIVNSTSIMRKKAIFKNSFHLGLIGVSLWSLMLIIKSTLSLLTTPLTKMTIIKIILTITNLSIKVNCKI
jgi:hypothetical protein